MGSTTYNAVSTEAPEESYTRVAALYVRVLSLREYTKA